MTLPTEPIGSIPRPGYLLDGLGEFAAGRIDAAALAELENRALGLRASVCERVGTRRLREAADQVRGMPQPSVPAGH